MRVVLLPLLVLLVADRVATCQAGVAPDPDDEDVQHYLSHAYYNVTYRRRSAAAFALDFEDLSQDASAVASSVSDRDDAWESVALPFVFSFYGHEHDTVVLNSNGFVAMMAVRCGRGFCGVRDGLPRYPQYIAPLYADWNPKNHAGSRVLYKATAARLVVQWHNVTLYSGTVAPPFARENTFTFQLVLEPSGDMAFLYAHVPFDPATRPYPNFGGTPYDSYAGVGDSIVIARGPYIYVTTYAPLGLDEAFLYRNRAVAALSALPTCVGLKSCAACVNHGEAGVLRATCSWCARHGVCTDGIGRETASFDASCGDAERLSTQAQCTAPFCWPACVHGTCEGGRADAGDFGACACAANYSGVACDQRAELSGGAALLSQSEVAGLASAAVAFVVLVACCVWSRRRGRGRSAVIEGILPGQYIVERREYREVELDELEQTEGFGTHALPPPRADDGDAVAVVE